MKMKNDSSRRTVVTLEWNAEDVGAVFSTMFRPGGQPTDDISGTNEMEFVENVKNNCFIYKADPGCRLMEKISVSAVVVW